MKTYTIRLFSIVFLLVSMQAYASQEISTSAEKPPQANKAAPEKIDAITIAIMDFESNAPGNPDLGSQISDIITARMSIYEQFRLVQRQNISDILKEHQLNLTGMVDTSHAIKIGNMFGAQIIVFGRAFPIDEDLYLAARIVSTETSRVKGIIVKGKRQEELSGLIERMVEKLLQGLNEWSPELLAKPDLPGDKISLLKLQIKDAKLPSLSVKITENHKNRTAPTSAAATEMKKVFQQIGFIIVSFNDTDNNPCPKNADIMITGEGFSEFGAQLNGLAGCSARLQVQAVDCKTQKSIASEQTTRRSVDLSETIAAQTALQAAGRELAFKLAEIIIHDETSHKKTD